MTKREPIDYVLSVHRNTRGERLQLEPFHIELYRDAWSERVIVMKSTQCGLSEWAVATMLAFSSCKLANFYVLPTEQLRNRFVSRLDNQALKVPHYQAALISPANNKSLKYFNGAAIAFVGSNSPVGFTEFPADVATIDELDRCHQENLAMVDERLAASKVRIKRQISNPTIEGFGIHERYNGTDRRKWHIKHDCGEWVQPDFFRHLVSETVGTHAVIKDPDWREGKEPRLICDRCGKPINRRGQGEWVAEHPSVKLRGYQISKLFSSQVSLLEIVDRYEAGLKSDIEMQRFYNGDLGLPYTSRGAKISRSDLESCTDPDYLLPQPGTVKFTAMGVDPGAVIRYCVVRAIDGNQMELIEADEAHTEDDLIQAMKDYDVRLTVIDAMPELQLVRRLQQRVKNVIKCSYLPDSSPNTTAKLDPHSREVKVNRTATLDDLFGLVRSGGLRLPANASSLVRGDYYAQMTAATRVYNQDRNYYQWVEGAARDDFMHAMNYAIIAKNIMLKMRAR